MTTFLFLLALSTHAGPFVDGARPSPGELALELYDAAVRCASDLEPFVMPRSPVDVTVPEMAAQFAATPGMRLLKGDLTSRQGLTYYAGLARGDREWSGDPVIELLIVRTMGWEPLKHRDGLLIRALLNHVTDGAYARTLARSETTRSALAAAIGDGVPDLFETKAQQLYVAHVYVNVRLISREDFALHVESLLLGEREVERVLGL